MKNLFFIIPVSILLFMVIIWTEPFHSEQQEEKFNLPGQSGPLHPGWHDQFMEMKAGQNGKIPSQAIRNIRAEQSRQLKRRGSGNLNNIFEIGPDNVGGRTRAMIVDIANPSRLLAGAVSGGIWESNNRGVSWHTINDQASNLSVTYLTQNPFDPDIIYYSTGEPRGNSAGIPGHGIYKSTDGGNSFQQLPATDTSLFDYNWRVVHSITDTHTLYVGTEDYGLFRSTNGGDTFEVVFSYTGRDISDIEVFADSSVMIGVRSGGVYYSPTGDANTFVKMENGLPPLPYQRVDIAYCDSFPNVIYAAFINNSEDDLLDIFKTVDGGQNWSVLDNPSLDGIRFSWAWYCNTLYVHHYDPDFVMLGSVNLGVTNDGGNNWYEADYSHADYHHIIADPFDSVKMYVCNDGGVYRYEIATSLVKNEDLNNGYNVTQFYAGSFFPDQNNIYGGTQDNGTQSSQSHNPSFDHVLGGDGSFTQIHQQFGIIAFASTQNGRIRRTDDANSQFPMFYLVMNEMDQDSDGAIDDGAWFINPYEMNRNDGEQLFFPTRKKVWKTQIGGIQWHELTKDLNFSTSGGRPYSIGISNDLSPTIYIGGSQGLFYRVDSALFANPGQERDLRHSIPDSVSNDFIVNIAVSPSYDSVIYVGFSNYSSDPRIYKVTDAKSDTPRWHAIHSDIPENVPVNWIEVSPKSDSVIAAATDFGLYTTIDNGVSWKLETDIPRVSIHNIRLRHHDGRLFVYTHGRGIWRADFPGDFPGLGENPPLVKTDISIYPNPVQSQLHINGLNERDVNYDLININGKIMQSGIISNNLINLQYRSTGVFFLRLYGKRQNKTVLKFIKL